MNAPEFTSHAEAARKGIEDAIAQLAGDLSATGGAPLPAVLWAITSGTVTAAAHTLALIARESGLTPAEITRMIEGLQRQIEDAFQQAKRMHGRKTH